MKEQIKPGFFGEHVCADDSRRFVDVKNEQFLYLGKKADWVFYGDSITAMWDVPLFFGNDNGIVVKRGICGDNTKYANLRYEADVLQLEPKNVILLIGVNDIQTIWPDLWWKVDGADHEVVLNGLKQNMEEMIKKSEGIKLYVCSILPTLLCPPFDRKIMNDMIIRANVIIKELCEKYKLTYIDYYTEMYDESIGGLPEDMAYDGLHPNGKGYVKMAEILKRETGLR